MGFPHTIGGRGPSVGEQFGAFLVRGGQQLVLVAIDQALEPRRST